MPNHSYKSSLKKKLKLSNERILAKLGLFLIPKVKKVVSIVALEVRVWKANVPC